MKWDIVFVFLFGFLCGGAIGDLAHQMVIQRMLFTYKDLPWRTKTRLARYFGWMRWSNSCAAVETAERAVYATILIGTLHDLGGPLLLAPTSKEAFDGMLAEAERRYTTRCRQRK
jgi:hypothetical protein